MRMQSRRSHAAESDTMRKIVVLAAIAALIAAAVGIWSTATFDRPKVAGDVQATEVRGAPVSPHEIMPSLVGSEMCIRDRKVAGDVQATEAPGAPVSPHEIMVKQGRVLPVEYWADPF